MSVLSNSFCPVPSFPSNSLSTSLLSSSPQLASMFGEMSPADPFSALESSVSPGTEEASTRELNLDPEGLESNPAAALQLNSAQGDAAEQITGGGEKKEKKSTAETVHDDVKYATTALTAPEKLKNAGELAAKIAEKGAAGELGVVSKLAEKAAPAVGGMLTKAGEAGEKLLAKTPVVGKYAGKISEYAERATGMLAGDADAFKDTAKDLANKGEAFAKGVKEGGSLKHGVAALKKEFKGETEGGKAVGEEAAKAGESAGTKAAEHAAVDAGEHAAEKAAVDGAEHVGAHAAEKVAGKLVGKLIPGVNIAVSAYSAYSDGKQAVNELKSGNTTGAIIDGLHTLTDAAGVVPGVGTAISIGGDLLAAGAHWLFGK